MITIQTNYMSSLSIFIFICFVGYVTIKGLKAGMVDGTISGCAKNTTPAKEYQHGNFHFFLHDGEAEI